jgi:hypothetical protein
MEFPVPTAVPPPPTVPLFDPTDATTIPTGQLAAVELLLETPTTLGLMHTCAVADGRDAFVEAIADAHEAAIADAVACVCNYAMLKVGYHGRLRYSVATVGEYWPGRLWLTRVSHQFATDRAGLVHDDVARLHDHIYLGVVGEDLRDGQRWPVDLYSVRLAAPELHARYISTVAQRLRESLGVVWGIPPRLDVRPELVEPALAQYVPDYPRVVCQAGPRTRERWIVRDLACPPPFDPDAS